MGWSQQLPQLTQQGVFPVEVKNRPNQDRERGKKTITNDARRYAKATLFNDVILPNENLIISTSDPQKVQITLEFVINLKWLVIL